MTTIITRHNETPGVQPTPGTVAVGELCVNTGDGTLWTSNDGGNVVPVGGGGGGGGDLPVGNADGQMLKWTQTGSPTWAITDAILVSNDNNVSVGGPQFSASYKFTVNGNLAIAGDLLMSDCIADSIQATNMSVSTDPLTANGVTRKSYTDATYQVKGNYATVNTTQTITGTKTFSNGITVSGGAFGGVSFTSLATGSNEYLKLGTTGIVFTSPTLALQDIDGLGALLQQLLVAINATPSQLSAATTVLINAGL